MSKKTGERTYLDSFLKALGFVNCARDEGEAPDFVIQLGDRRLGIEVVQVFADQGATNSKKRQDESHRLTLLRNLCHAYYEAGGSSATLRLQVEPGYFQRIRGRIPPELRDRLLTRLLARTARMNEGATLTSRVRGRHQSLLATMWIRRLPDSFGRYSRWQLLNDSMAWVPTLSREYLNSIVARKAGKLAAYQRRVPDVVLLMVADGSLASGLVRYDDGSVERRGFEAVYLFHHPKGEVQELAAPARPWSDGD
mgnify:CR=1 FL=1